ncbi:MAG: Uma2 family endonuclease [Vulcanimicrobiaceae bacterium]|jgi:Uma2 family endonuclease
MSLHEIVLPETKPETEWILGRPVQKVSPFRIHARLQLRLGVALYPWAEGRGEVGSEWRFRIAPPHEIRRPLVPDLAYISYARLEGLEGHDLDAPPCPPDVAFEILSAADRPRHVAHKISVYLAAGTALVVVVEPRDRTVHLHDACGERILRGDDVLTHDALPSFALALPELFAAADPPRPPANTPR